MIRVRDAMIGAALLAAVLLGGVAGYLWARGEPAQADDVVSGAGWQVAWVASPCPEETSTFTWVCASAYLNDPDGSLGGVPYTPGDPDGETGYLNNLVAWLGANGCEWRDPVVYPTGAQGELWPRAIVLFRCP
jgi:hypothetical protein